MEKSQKPFGSSEGGNKRKSDFVPWDYLGNLIPARSWETRETLRYSGVTLRKREDRIKLRGNLRELVKRAVQEWDELSPEQKKKSYLEILFCKN